MKRTRINPISKKRKEILSQEAITVSLLLEQYGGRCMKCNKLPDWRGLQKSHTRDRKHFILVCAKCHSPNGAHKYLEDKGAGK